MGESGSPIIVCSVRALMGSVSRVNSTQETKRIHYMEIVNNANVSIGIFCMPRGSFFPAHNHPNMAVYS